MSFLLEIKNLQITHQEQQLFAPVHFTLEQGQIIQIAGSNGAGKTSLLKVLAGLKHARRGSFYWQNNFLSKPLQTLQQNSFFLAHELAIKPSLTVYENLYAFASLNNTLDKLPKTLSELSLISHQDQWVGRLSNGQQRRVALAKLCLNKAPLWLLDEPFVALDQDNIALLLKLFEGFLNKGGTIVFTSHQRIDFAPFNIIYFPLAKS